MTEKNSSKWGYPLFEEPSSAIEAPLSLFGYFPFGFFSRFDRPLIFQLAAFL